MAFADAERFIARCTEQADAFARAALRSLKTQASGFRLTGICVIAASGRALPDLRGILASHALIHAAEGEFYRDVLLRAAEKSGLPANRLKEKDAAAWLAARLGLDESELGARLAVMGKALGPPWGADQKLATMAAWLALLS